MNGLLASPFRFQPLKSISGLILSEWISQSAKKRETKNAAWLTGPSWDAWSPQKKKGRLFAIWGEWFYRYLPSFFCLCVWVSECMCVGGRAHLCVCAHAFTEGKNKAFKKKKTDRDKTKQCWYDCFSRQLFWMAVSKGMQFSKICDSRKYLSGLFILVLWERKKFPPVPRSQYFLVHLTKGPAYE